MKNKSSQISTGILSRPFIIIAVFALALYVNTAGHGFAMDDEFVTVKNPLVSQGASAIPEILTSKYFSNSVASFGYRPLTKVTFALEHEFTGGNPMVSHIINILLYILCSWLVYKAIRRLLHQFGGPALWITVTLLWVAHPLHTEVVASLKNREEILFLIFGLLSLFSFIRYSESGKWINLAGGVLFFSLSYLSKQSALAFVLVIPFTLWFIHQSDFWCKYRRWAYSTAALIVCGWFFYRMPGWFFTPDQIELLSFENPLRFDPSISSALSLSSYSMLINLKLLLFPHPIVFYYGQFTIPEVSLTSFWVLFSIMLHLILMIFVVLKRKKYPLLFFGTFFYLLAIFPLSNLLMEINGIVAERFLFAPGIGFAIATGFILFSLFRVDLNTDRFGKLPFRFITVVCVILFLYGAKTIARNSSWKNALTLYSNDIRYLPKSVKAYDILAEEMMAEVMKKLPYVTDIRILIPTLDSVITYYQKTLSLYPDNSKALNNIGNIYLNFHNRPQDALIYLKKAYALKDSSFQIVFNLAQTYERLQQDSLSALWYHRALEIDHSYPKTWENIINLYIRSGNADSVKSISERYLEKGSKKEIAYTGLGSYYLMKQDTVAAVEYWEKAFALNPANRARAEALAKYFYIKGDSVKAKYYYSKSR